MSSAEFDWQIGSEYWGDEPDASDWSIDLPWPGDHSSTDAATPLRRRNWRATLVTLLALGLLGAAVYGLIGQRLEDVSGQVTENIRGAYDLIQYAVGRSDAELFKSLLLSYGDSSWSDIQRVLFRQGLIVDRRPLGLRLQMDNPIRVDVAFEPGTTRAEVVAEYAYSTDAGAGVTQTVRLRQAALYRFERQRWLLAQQDEVFWGETLGTGDRFLALTYPQRDEPISLRLAHDLNALLSDVCFRAGDALCPLRFPVRVQLVGRPWALIEFSRQANAPTFFDGPAGGTSDIVLPAPTLIGVPSDEAGYQAVYRVYAIQLLKTLMNRQLDRQANELMRVYYQNALDTEFIRLGLRSWPAAEVQRGPQPAPVDGPGQDVALYCIADIAHGGNLLRYRPAAGDWRVELSNRIFSSIHALPKAGGLVLQEQTVLTDSASSRLVLWQGGQAHPLFSNAATIEFTGETDPAGRNLLVASRASRQRLLDLDTCGPTGCTLTPLPGWPVWSPQGTRLLFDDVLHQRLFRSPGVPLGAGYNPFWLDEETFGYVRSERVSGARLRFDVVVDSLDAAGSPQVLFGSEALLALLPDEVQHYQFSLNTVTPNPADTDLLLIAAGADESWASSTASETRLDRRRYFFLFDRRTARLSLAFEFRDWNASAAFSPDGRWLSAVVFDSAAAAQTLRFLDVERGQVTSFALPANEVGSLFATEHSWSADGQWFLLLSDGVLHLIAPAPASHQTVVPESPGCVFAAWVDRA